MVPVYHGKDLRKGRVSIPGQIYHVTTVTRAREPVFQDLNSARRVIQVLMEIQSHELADTLAFVVMPDHVHWLLQLGERRPLSCVIASMKSISARRIGRGKIWLAGFHDHALRRDEDLRQVARYIVANPLRAGLVDDIGHYPHWDAIWL
ncbi:REP-associated tyrosine transposase [endosymbiont of unidentified scaly snail isolate Monju]|jgi:REP element-mobilizing transposase RayT|uniref:REP-associated tyrosine transposase n=1 Tax=endosymbiont of unidentified scaly snail isolate Monju TaxID=1248727 RepID=UPI0003892A49|nr:transposase [endosymbiont of unidentified scaly snail isolate Monju]BAN68622.1 conserved hypothetical protein [endosymbiont of unidentified scaly snail isolate Monju]